VHTATCAVERRWALAHRRGCRIGARSRPVAARQRRGLSVTARLAAPLAILVRRSATLGRRGHRPIPIARCHDVRSSTGQARQSILHERGRSCRPLDRLLSQALGLRLGAGRDDPTQPLRRRVPERLLGVRMDPAPGVDGVSPGAYVETVTGEASLVGLGSR
jgi:hypothetical protein